MEMKEAGSLEELMSMLKAASGRPERTIISELEVNQGDMLEILGLMDNDDKESTRVSKYQLWSRIQELYPGTIDGRWLIDASSASAIVLKQYVNVEEPNGDEASGD